MKLFGGTRALEFHKFDHPLSILFADTLVTDILEIVIIC
jgi:hypothetical protein